MSETAKRGVILLPDPKDPSKLAAYTLCMTNASQIDAGSIIDGEPILVCSKAGVVPNFPELKEDTTYSTSVWRYGASEMRVIYYTNHLFMNETWVPQLDGKKVKFKLYTNQDTSKAPELFKGDTKPVLRFGDDASKCNVIPALETVLVAKDFKLDGIVSVVTYKNTNGGPLNFAKSGIEVTLHSAGVRRGKINTLHYLPIHNLYEHGAWCFRSDAAVALKFNPMQYSPTALFNDLISSPGNLHLEVPDHNNVFGEAIPSAHDPKTAPLIRMKPGPGMELKTLTMDLPPFWSLL